MARLGARLGMAARHRCRLPDPKAAASAHEPLVARWLAAIRRFDGAALGAPISPAPRLLMALGHAPLILSSPDQIYRSPLLSAMATWARHLDRAAFRLPDGLPHGRALCGLYAAGVLIPGGEARRRQRWQRSIHCSARWCCPMAASRRAPRAMRWRWRNGCCSPPAAPPPSRCGRRRCSPTRWRGWCPVSRAGDG